MNINTELYLRLKKVFPIKKLLTVYILFSSLNLFSQGMPKVVLKDSTQLRLSDLKIDVNITGNFATTTYTMKFYNGLDRTLEGELAFPLGQGQSVSRFAMDLNGKLREAVIIEKELARVAYETTVRQNIDPALLEKTSGNNYKARVYPILPKKFKQIVLTYEESLSNSDNKLVYELPLGIDKIIDEFSLNIQVFGSSKQPVITSKSLKEFLFVKKGNVTSASIDLKKVIPNESVKVEIENSLDKEKVLTYRDYFYGYIPLKAESRDKKKPKKINILWDASYSMKNRNIDKELELLNNYFQYLQNVEVKFISFNNKINKQLIYTITNGNWDGLKKEIQLQIYDGGTNFNIFNKFKANSDENLLFSDGLTNLGGFKRFNKKPIYTINSLLSANHFSLEKIATNTGGLYINLSKLSAKNANQLLKQEILQFLGIKENNQIEEVYPKENINITSDFVITGRFKNKPSIELLFGYQGKISKTKVIKLGDSQNSELVKRLWSQQKLNYLNQEKELNKNQIISLAKQHHLITDYTSMLILDRIEDYVRYKIEPPNELRSQYKELLKQKEENESLANEDIQDRKEDLFDEYQDILDWYNTTFPKKNQKIKKKVITQNTTRETGTVTIVSQTNRINNQNTEIDYSKRVATGVIKDSSGALPGVSVLIKGTIRGTETDFDGKFAMNVEENDILIFSYLGYSKKEMRIGTTNKINIILEEDTSVLDEVVVIGYGVSTEKKSLSYSVTSIFSESLSGKVSGVNISDNTVTSNFSIESGNTTITDSQPLYIVDGIPVNINPMVSLKSEDIDAIQVLKASNATKLYGTRARNGLIIITTKKGKEINKKAIEELNKKIEEKIELKAWNPKTPYLDILLKEPSIMSTYIKYLEIRDTYSNSPMFYLDVSNFFDSKGSQELAIRVLTNLIEIDLDNYELIKALAYKLEYFKQYELAKKIYKKVLELRPEEPQSYRDLALIYELDGDYQNSFDLLYKLYNGELLGKDEDERFEGIESIAFIELTRLVSLYGNKLKLNKHQKKFFKPISVDVRIVVDWNHNDTDIDLWVIDPTGEKAYYKNPETSIGGRMSNDMTSGYGPEEFILKKAVKGKYQIMIDYYSDNVQKISGPTILKVTMYTNYGKKNEKKETIVVTLDKQEDYLEIGNLFFDK